MQPGYGHAPRAAGYDSRVSTLSQARTALASQLQALFPDLRVSEKVPPQVNPPAAIIAPNTSDLADYEQAMSSDLVLWYLRVVLIVSRASDMNAQDIMDGYLSTTGDTSIPAAIRSDPTLGGAAEWAEVKNAQRYGNMNYNGVDFLGCELVIEVSC
jgi:hypothetical protein